MTERSVFYNCRMFAEGFLHGKPYGELESCIHVGILDFRQMKSPGFHHFIQLQEEKTGEVYCSKFAFHVIELKKIEEASEVEKEEEQELYRWAKLIAAKSWEAVCMEAKGNPYMEAAKDEMDRINQDKTQRWLYLRREMALSDEQSRLLSAERKGEAQGEKYFAELVQKLLEDSRIEDLKKAVEDESFREELYIEYGIRQGKKSDDY